MMMSLLWAAANFQAKPGGCKGSRFLHPTSPYSPTSSSAPSIFPVIKRVTKECKIKTHPCKWRGAGTTRGKRCCEAAGGYKDDPFCYGSFEPFSLWFHWKTKIRSESKSLFTTAGIEKAYSCTISHDILSLTAPNPLEECGAHPQLSCKLFAYLNEASTGCTGSSRPQCVCDWPVDMPIYLSTQGGHFALLYCLSDLRCRSGLCAEHIFLILHVCTQLWVVFREVP